MHTKTVYFEFLAGRPVLMTSRRRIAASTEVSLSFARYATAARRISLFFAGTPAFRQRLFNAAIKAYSGSGMVKLSRTSLGFFTLAGLPFLFVLATKGSGGWVAVLAAAGFLLATTRATGFFTADVAALTAAGEAAWVAFDRGARLMSDGLVLAAVALFERVADVGFLGALVSTVTANLQCLLNRINSICCSYGT
jgi:hypothetical protein